ncbi:hypothetical protein [Streptomyces sp. NPDC020298]|uniref:hypothetical protein n=1 Tax=unclassified Streptomyces TaxID=2593676 RepID=UPI0033E5315A
MTTPTVLREPPNHDTTTCYTKYGCRRPECTDRYNANERERARLHRAGEYRHLTDAAPVRAHVQQLIAAGASPRGIALRAQTSLRVVSDLLPPRSSGRRTPVRHRLLTSNAEKLLAVSAGDVIPQYVPALGTSRRLRALVADAWPMTEIAGWVDLYPGYISALIGRASLYDDAQVMGATALKVARGYDTLRVKRPSRYGISRRSASYVRNLAKRRNWPPTRYWDQFPGAIDDPHFIPEYGKARITVIAEEAHWLMTAGRLDRGLVAERLGVDRTYVDKALHQHPEYAPEVAA